jgi:hypothetical protein
MGKRKTKKRREKGKAAEIGPLFEVRGKPLIKYARGEKKNYYELTLPQEFMKLYQVEASHAGVQEMKQGQTPSEMLIQLPAKQPTVNLYFSRHCMNYLLMSHGQWPTLAKGEETKPEESDRPVRVSLKDIKNLMGGAFPTSAGRAYLREQIFAMIEQGHERILVEAERPLEFDAAWEVINDIMLEARGLAHVDKDRVAKTITILIRDDPKEAAKLYPNAGMLADRMLDLKRLTEHMLDEVLSLLHIGISALEGFRGDEKTINVALETLESLKGKHAYIDFLWAYNCRQLVRGGRYGLFCGTGLYTPVTPVALGSFFKLLEHAVDQMMAILQVVGSCSAMGPDEKSKKFMIELIRQLNENAKTLEEIKTALLHSIENDLNEKDKTRIVEILKLYHETVRSQLGISDETYFRSALPSVETPVKLPLPLILATLKEVDIDKAIWLAQVLYPLQKICKFPANVAMLAGILFLPTTRKPLLNVSQ